MEGSETRTYHPVREMKSIGESCDPQSALLLLMQDEDIVRHSNESWRTQQFWCYPTSIISMDDIKMHYVYWIRGIEHTDINTEGYVGISNQPFRRLKAHTTDTALVGSRLVRERVNQQGIHSIEHSVIAECVDLTQAQVLEATLRPVANIGWNIKKGGGTSPDCSGRTHTPETKEKIRQSNLITKGSRTYVSPFKGMTDRFSEDTKAKIGAAQRGKEISQAHRQAITEKLSGINSPVRKEVALMDVNNPSDIREFISLKEAADTLGINYSTLRAACQKGNVTAKRWKQVEVPG